MNFSRNIPETVFPNSAHREGELTRQLCLAGLLPWERLHCDGGEFVLDARAVSWNPRIPGMEGPGRSNKEGFSLQFFRRQPMIVAVDWENHGRCNKTFQGRDEATEWATRRLQLSFQDVSSTVKNK